MCSKSNLTTSDTQDKRRRACREVYSSEGYKVYSRTLNQLCPGTYTFTWDGTVNRTSYPTNNIAPAGLYTFDITVNGKTPNGLVLNDDKDRMRSSALKIGDHEVNGAPPNNFEARYLLSDTKPAYAAGVKVFGLTDDKGWTQVWEGTSGGTALSPTWNEVLAPGSVIDLLEEWRVVFWAIDDHIELDKAHRRKPALEVNKNPCIGTAIDIGIKGKLSDVSGGTFDVDMSTAAEYAAHSQDWVYFPKKGAILNCVSVPVEWYYDRIFPWLSREAGLLWLIKATPPQNSSGAKVIGAGYYIGVLPRGSSKPKKKQINTPYIDVYYALERVNIFYLATHMKDEYGSEVWLGKGTYLTASNVNQLPFELSYIRCVLLLHCTHLGLTSDEEKIAQSLLQAFYQKKAQFVAGIIGGPLPQLQAKEFSTVFWTLATKGTYYNGEYYFCPLYTAVWVAFAYAYYNRGPETPSGGNEAVPRPFYQGPNGLLYIPPQ